MLDGLVVLRFIRDSAQQLRTIATDHPSKITSDLLQIASEMDSEAAAIEKLLARPGRATPARMN
jgi:hypothetical protein